MNTDDIIVAVIIALVILAVLACWRFKLRPADLDGYWEAITECGIHWHEEHDNA